MATLRRSLTPGGTYFFTVNTHRWHRILTERRVAMEFDQATGESGSALWFGGDRLGFANKTTRARCVATVILGVSDSG